MKRTIKIENFIPTMKKFIPICDSCSGRDKCPIPEKEKQTKASCPDELSDKYFLKILPTWERPSYKNEKEAKYNAVQEDEGV